MMTRKDYELIARAIAKAARRDHPLLVAMKVDQFTIGVIIGVLEVELAADNPRFDGSKFRYRIEELISDD